MSGLRQTVCDVNGPHDHENYKANADLIAAAPDLLEALEACAKRMEELQKITNYPLAWPRTLAQKAIAKARGEM